MIDNRNYFNAWENLNSLEFFFDYKYPRYHGGQKMKPFLAC